MVRTGKTGKIKLLIVCLLALLWLAACGQQDGGKSLADIEVQQYAHPTNGATLTLPAEWEMLSEVDEATVFADAENTISFSLLRELAGFSYYSPEGLAELAEELIGGVLTEPKILLSVGLRKPDGTVLVTAAGELPDDGGAAVCEVAVFSPLAAVRYFAVVVAEADAYRENQQLLEEIYTGFALNKTEDEIYEQLAPLAEKLREQEAAE